MTITTPEIALARWLSKRCRGLWRIIGVLHAELLLFAAPLLFFTPMNASATLGTGLQFASQEESLDEPPTVTAGARRVEKEHRVLLDPEGKPLPFKSPEEVLDFLKTAREIERKSVGEGVTGVERLLLEKNGLRMHAVFRDVKVFKSLMDLADGTSHINFRDDAVFECAAFELNRLLGLYIVPPVVKLSMRRNEGTLQAWVHGTMTERERLEKEIEPPDMWRWMMQRQIMNIFDNLIYNDDRNVGNILIAEDWLLILIDHTRSFRDHEKLMSPDSVRYCDRNLLENMKKLDLETVQKQLGPYLRGQQIRALMKRRDLLVEHIERLVEKHGAGKVLFSFIR